MARALVGTEGTCVTVLEATLRLVDWPRFRSLLALGYPDVFSAGDHVPEVMRFHPIALEGIDDRLITDMHKKGAHRGASAPSSRTFPRSAGWASARSRLVRRATVRGLAVADGRVDLEFRRRRGGAVDVDVLRVEGDVDVVVEER